MKKHLLLVFILFFASINIFCEESYENIPNLVSKKGSIFNKYQHDIEEANKAMFLGKNSDEYIKFYTYTVKEEDKLKDVQQLAARCSIRYDTLACLNGIANSTDSIEGRTFILPVANGLYIPEEPVSSIEVLLAGEYAKEVNSASFSKYTINGRAFYFIPDGRFSSTQRAFFLDPGLVMPLKKSVLTSPFGMRVSPISGRWLLHKGVDLAAPTGTEIYACKSGKVTSAVSMDPAYGNYIIIDHGKGMTSLYAHMSRLIAQQGSNVSAGQVIGEVGQTGMATGPHLHFEIRLNGELQDPLKYLPSKK